MKTSRRIKAILASLLVTTALAAPAAVLSSGTADPDAELYFTGMSLEMLADGSVQAIFEVGVEKVLNCDGASFILDYNPEYFTPSYINAKQVGSNVYVKNQPFTTASDPEDDGFFAYDQDLYAGNDPFQKEVTYNVDTPLGPEPRTSKYSAVVLSEHRLSMDLWFDREKIINAQPMTGIGLNAKHEEKPVGKLTPLRGVSLGGQLGNENETVYVINKYDTLDNQFNADPTQLDRVVLGQISFWVNPDRLDEIARYFPQPAAKTTKAEVTMEGGAETYLIRTVTPTAGERESGRDNWQMGTYQRAGGTTDPLSKRYYRASRSDATYDDAGLAERYYELAVDPKQLMKVRPAEKEVTINAYQAFTDGSWDDVAQALRRYSPIATVTYVDGTQDNWVIPWGKEGADAEYTIEVEQADGTFLTVDRTTNTPAYSPLEGVYRITQYVPGKSAHPIPITVKLTVTPIRLTDVEVEDQTLTYDLDSVVSMVDGPSKLELPERARLITDIVPSGVSMVMSIPGWTPEKWSPTEGKWPVATDSNTTILMNTLKEDSFGTADAPTGEEGFNAATMPYWPDDADNGAIALDQYWRFMKQKNNNWIGEYTFHMADSFGGNVKNGFTRAEIQAVYPWLTVEEDEYAVPDALRQIVTDESYTNALSYKADYVSTTVVNGQPQLTLSVEHANGVTPMAENSIFRVWLPNGQELGTGLTAAVWPDDTAKEYTKNWFPDQATDNEHGSYNEVAQNSDSTRYFHLVTNPGDPETGREDTRDNRETLRRYINLGGWYQVSVCEDPARKTWSDPMPVFVPARTNEYQEDKTYNFVGENNELFNWPGGLTHYVTMPRGSYTAVTDKGLRLYDAGGTAVTLAEMQADPTTYGGYLDDKGRPASTTARYEEFYGYHTTYDGSTGAQPGTLYSFRVGAAGTAQGAAWTPVRDGVTHGDANPANAQIWRYGATQFYDGAVYPAYVANLYHDGIQYRTSGVVTQPAAASTYDVTIRRNDDQLTPKPKRSHITLTSAEPAGITRRAADDQVTLATYDTRMVDYTDRQAYTFTITNDGDVPIYGLAIDGLTDGFHTVDPDGGRFVLLQAPADFLAPGQSTTFVMTYVYNLPANGLTNPDRYIDRLYIVSSDHPNGKPGGTNQDDPAADPNDNDYLLHFDAQFEVTGERTHTVTVVVNPADRQMGDAGLIVGQTGGTGAMNYTPTARAYAEGTTVYVAVYMEDEYELREVPTAVDAAGNPIHVDPLVKTGYVDPSQPGVRVFWFTMPDYDTTVTVNFYEPDLSKLRLSDLVDFSAGTDDELKPNADPTGTANEYKVWRKSYTTQERTDAENWHNTTSQSPEADLYLATVGTTVPRNQGGRQFISTENQYIVVIPYEAKRSQVEAKLRQVVTHYDDMGLTHNVDIKPEVTMLRYKSGFAEEWAATGTAPAEDRVYPTTQGDTAVPTVHTSHTFDSPEPGTSDYVRITVSIPGTTEVRHFYLEIHRAPEEPIATLNYGNSPYGMIMNDALFERPSAADTKAAQDAVKETFRNNGYTFYGLEDLNVPRLVRRPAADGGPAVSQRAVYWREAWVHNTQLFEPESLTGFVNIAADPDPGDSDGTTPTRRPVNYVPDPAVYSDGENLDLNDYAFFAILGQDMKEPGVKEALDSTGRPVDLEDIHARVTVTLLDTTATDQIGRFSGAKTATLDLGVAGQLLTGLTGPGVPSAAGAGTWPVSSTTEPDPANSEQEITTYTQVENIRPGQYVLEYVYTDYNGDSLTVTRPLVILSPVGDVNSDGAVDSTRAKAAGKSAAATDEATLKNRVADPLGYVAGRWEQVSTNVWEEAVYPRANIFKYRVADVNNDRNINNIDGNLIDKIARGEAAPICFYNPVDYVAR